MWWDFIVIALQYILTTYFCIDYVIYTASGTPVAWQLQTWPSGQKVWPRLTWGQSTLSLQLFVHLELYDLNSFYRLTAQHNSLVCCSQNVYIKRLHIA